MEKKKREIRIALDLAFLVLCGGILYLATFFLYKVYPNLALAKDLLFSNTPYVNILWLADLIVTIAAASFIIYMIQHKKVKELPFYAVILGIYYLLKAIFIYLTPLGNPHPNPGTGLTFLPSGGMFPSGHLGTIFLFFLFTLDSKSKYWKGYFIILCIFEATAMILSRGHYTIDLVGALFIAYTVWKIGSEHFKKRLVLK
jgi:membrane-associated phospholipid phosphatase